LTGVLKKDVSKQELGREIGFNTGGFIKTRGGKKWGGGGWWEYKRENSSGSNALDCKSWANIKSVWWKRGRLSGQKGKSEKRGRGKHSD